MLDPNEIDDNAAIVLLGGAPHVMPAPAIRIGDAKPGDAVQHWADEMVRLLRDGEIFRHTSKTGLTSIVKLLPGTPVQVMSGRLFKHLQREAYMAAQQQALANGNPIPMRTRQ